LLVNNSGVITDGTWNGDVIGLQYGGRGANLLSDTGFLYVSGGVTTASNTISIARTDLTANSPLSLTGNILSLNTGGDWTSIESNIAASSPYSWTLPELNSEDCFHCCRLLYQ
jgi:hypothetical protein